MAGTKTSTRITVLPRYRRRGLWVGSAAAGAGCVLGGTAIALLDNPDTQLFAGSLAGILLLLGVVIYRLSFGWVIADQAGIRRSRLLGSLLIPWAQVRDIVIGTVDDNYRYRCIIVFTTSGRRYLLPAPAPVRPGSTDIAVLTSSHALLCRLWRRHGRHQP